MSSKDTIKEDGENNNIDTITGNVQRLVLSEDTNKECTSCEQINNINVLENITEDSVAVQQETCASCGKEGNRDDMNTCNKCKMVKYCNAACKKKHRSKHKKACERRVAELHDEQLFKDHPLTEECPICMLPLPLEFNGGQVTFYACCGKKICNGCIYTLVPSMVSEGKDLCPFCRMPAAYTDQEDIKRLKILMSNGNADAFNHFAGYYYRGSKGIPQDYVKANELLLKAGNLGCAAGYNSLGNLYRDGEGVERDDKKAQYYWELAAMDGIMSARQNLGVLEHRGGNSERAMRHLIIAAKAGSEKPMHAVKVAYKGGLVTKDEFASILRVHHERKKELKSDARDKAAVLMRDVNN